MRPVACVCARVCMHTCLCVHTSGSVWGVWCVQQVVYTLWPVSAARGGVCSKQPGLSVCGRSGAMGGQRCCVWPHCLLDPTGSLLGAVGQPRQLDRDGRGAEWLG